MEIIYLILGLIIGFVISFLWLKGKMTQDVSKANEQLAALRSQLEAEQKQLEEALCSGRLSVEELTEKSKRLPFLKEQLDEMELRWLELSELA